MSHWISTAIACAALSACQSLPLDDPRLAFEHPQHGLTEGPDGWYMTRQDGAWGTSAQQSLWRLEPGASAVTRPDWSDPQASDSSFYFSEAAALACFVSTRAVPGTADASDPNIWCMRGTGSAWSAPEVLPAPVNSSAREWSPVIARDGSIYFASDRPDGLGLGDLYRAQQIDGEWQVEPLSRAINSAGGEWNLDLSPDGRTLVFEASHRETNRTVSGDLYISTWQDGAWSAATPLDVLNTDGSDLLPRFIDARRFIYTSIVDGTSRFRIGTID